MPESPSNPNGGSPSKKKAKNDTPTVSIKSLLDKVLQPGSSAYGKVFLILKEMFTTDMKSLIIPSCTAITGHTLSGPKLCHKKVNPIPTVQQSGPLAASPLGMAFAAGGEDNDLNTSAETIMVKVNVVCTGTPSHKSDNFVARIRLTASVEDLNEPDPTDDEETPTKTPRHLVTMFEELAADLLDMTGNELADMEEEECMAYINARTGKHFMAMANVSHDSQWGIKINLNPVW
jgi:hypothetical protein